MVHHGCVRGRHGSACAIVALWCLLALAFAGSAWADITPVSNFSKVGTDAATGSSTAGGSTATAHAGDTINWVLSYRNKTGTQANVDVTDPITGNQTYVPGSLKTPPGLAPRWSTDGGSTWATSEPSSGVNGVGATGTSVDGSTGPQSIFSSPTQSFNAGNSQGDGWEALFIGNDIYNVHHHRGANTPPTILDCHDKNTGAQCPGYPVQFVSATAGVPFGSGTDTLTGVTYSNSAVDAANGLIFAPMGVEGGTSIGVLCIDVTNRQSCGYTQLGDGAFPNLSGAPQMSGGAQIGTNYYIVGAGDGAPVYCYDMTTKAACANWPAAGVPSDPSFAPSVAVNAFTMENYGGYLFTSVYNPDNPAASTRDLGCVVAATATPCPGFPILNVTNPSNWTGLAPLLDTSGGVTGICAEIGTPDVTTGYQCYSVPGGTPLGAPPFDQMVPNAGVGFTNLSGALQIGTRLYFDYISGGNTNGPVTYTCFDFAINAPCQGFVPVPGGTVVRPYTLRQDPNAPDCIWELGDAGVFEVFSATFGGSLGCNTGSTNIDLSPGDYYCDGKSGHITGWDRLRVGLTPSQYDAISVTITDDNGAPVPGWSGRVIPSSQMPADISSIPYAGATTTLHLSVTIAWGAHPVVQGVAMEATFKGDAPQICYQTKVGDAKCADAQPLENQATAVTAVAGGASDAPDDNSSEKTTFNEPADPNLCTWELGVQKNVVKSPSGPDADVGYEVVVTNYGPDAARNVQVNDPIPAGLTFVSGSDGCAQDGGSVTCSLADSLAAGESHTFTITLHVPPTLAGMVNNAVRACSDKPDVGPDPTGCAPPPDCVLSGACPCPPEPTADDPHPNVACASVFVPPVPPVPLRTQPRWDLGVVKKAMSSPLIPGKTMQYQVVVTNYGPDPATSVVAKDNLPLGLSFVSASAGCSAADAVVTCTGTSLAPGKSQTFTITTRVSKSQTRGVTNAVRVCSDSPSTATSCDPPADCRSSAVCAGAQCTPAALRSQATTDPHPNTACVTVPIAPQLRLSKTVDKTVVSAGDTLVYTLKATNPSKLTLRNVKTCDKLPSGLAYVSSHAKAKLSGGQYCWTVRQLAPGRSVSYKITVRVLNGHSGTLKNPASATADNARRRTAVRAVQVASRPIPKPSPTG